MKHFLITQWNVDLYDLGWLKRRQKVFERYTLPSVEAQLNKNFEWILISDSRTPDKFKSVLDGYPATVVYYDFEHYKWIDTSSKLSFLMQQSVRLETIGDVVAECIGQLDTDYVITSRCDNDDMISVDHMSRIQQLSSDLWHKRQEDKFWVSLVRGYRWCNDKTYPFNSKCNSFISFVENPKDLQTAHQCCHTLANKTKYPLNIIRSGEPTWAEVIHGENVLNRLKRFKGEAPASGQYGRFNFNG